MKKQNPLARGIGYLILGFVLWIISLLPLAGGFALIHFKPDLIESHYLVMAAGILCGAFSTLVFAISAVTAIYGTRFLWRHVDDAGSTEPATKDDAKAEEPEKEKD